MSYFENILKKMKQEKIAILMGGKSEEADISRRSAQTIYQHLAELGLNVQKQEVDHNVIDSLKKGNFTLVYNSLHGRFGEDGIIQANLEFNHIAYTGEGILASALCLNKVKTKNVLNANFIKTPKHHCFDYPDEIENIISILDLKQLNFPLVLKPIAGGSSIGIQMLEDQSALTKQLKQIGNQELSRYYLEERIRGREITVGICYRQHQKMVLPPIELKPKKDFYDFEAKYTHGMTEVIIPACLSKSLKIAIGKIAERVITIFQFRECVRLDFMINQKEIPHVLEINTSPGMTETSDIPKMLEKGGFPIKEYLVENLYRAKKRKKSR